MNTERHIDVGETITVEGIPSILHGYLATLQLNSPSMELLTRQQFFAALLEHSALRELEWDERENY